MAILEVSHIEKHFGRTNVLKDVSFSMETDFAGKNSGSLPLHTAFFHTSDHIEPAAVGAECVFLRRCRIFRF